MKHEWHIRGGDHIEGWRDIIHTETVITKTGSIEGPGIGPILHEVP